MFGLDDLAIAGLIASLAGTAANVYGQQQSARAVNKASNDAMMHQNSYASKIQQMAQDRAQEYEQDTRKEQQDAITDELANTYTQQPLTASQIASDASTTQGDVSSDYESAKADSNARVQDSINTFGNLMARINGAKTLRQRENWANADVGNQVGVQQALMQSQNRLDNYKIQQAQNKGSGWQTAGGLLSTAGSLATLGSALAGLGTSGVTTGIKEGINAGKGALDASSKVGSQVASKALNAGKSLSAMNGLNMFSGGLNPTMASNVMALGNTLRDNDNWIQRG